MIKTFSFAIMHFAIAFTVAYLLTGDLVVGGAVALIEPMVNTVGYYVHEQVWQRLASKRAANSAERVPAQASQQCQRQAVTPGLTPGAASYAASYAT
jgi:uncharacterized membrane protein